MLYQTHAQIHLGNIRVNIEGIRKAVGSGRKILIAVKANGYGHGAIEISRMAERIGVDWLGVATVPEGIQLREAGIKLPILKFSPVFPEEIGEALRNDLTLAVCDEESSRAVQAVCAADKLKARVHMKVDTGMGRVGISPQKAPGLAAFIEKSCPDVYLEGVFSHFPVSDEKETDFTKSQITAFKAVVDSVNETIGRKIDIAHCSNSGAVLGHQDAWLDMVRPGIMIYGY